MSAKRLYRAYKNYIFVGNIFYVWYLSGQAYNYLLSRTLRALDNALRISSAGCLALRASQPADSADNPSGKLVCRRGCLLNPLVVRRGAPSSRRMKSAARCRGREASSTTSNYTLVRLNTTHKKCCQQKCNFCMLCIVV